MVACAKFLGRDVSTCTRGINNCVCISKIEKIRIEIGKCDWDKDIIEIEKQCENLIIKFVNEEIQACTDLCRELYSNDGITCADEIKNRLI